MDKQFLGERFKRRRVAAATQPSGARWNGVFPSPKGAARGRHQNQAFHVLLFLFGQVLGRPFGQVEGVTRAEDRRTMIYTHVLNRPGVAVRSPLDE